ncbi:major facilitator superfamily domain-containing protein [Pyrenochaeta sp. MPI-SDFR-AT-0127]|nr:major facilitator superfamily domain-containing protein [Pyrenochaeta sp. MPI-SDFR-AT-0127]
MDPSKVETSTTYTEHLEKTKTADLISAGGIFLDIEGRELSIKTAKDGHTILVPQPSDDPNDPVNWSWMKKHLLLFTVAWGALCADFTSAGGIPCIFLQGAEWHMDPNKVNYANNLNVLMMGIGGLLWIPMISFWGRAPVLFWTCVCGTLLTLGATLSPNFEVHYAMRSTMGFFLTAPQTISIAYIKDIFFFHEHARKIGLWACLYISSPYIGPLFANFIVDATGDWRLVFWLCFGICCLQLVLIVLFLDESYYNRTVKEQPARGSRILRVIGLWQIQNHGEYFYSLQGAVTRLISTVTKPALLLLLVGYFLSFMWSIGINITTAILFATPVAFGGYGFSATAVGFLYFTPVVAVFIGEIFGHYFNDFLANRYIHRHKGIFEPEVRLITVYLSTILMVPGLILLGFALQQHMHYGVIIVGWGMFTFGVMTTSVAVTTYAIDAYPTAPGEVSGYINFMRVIGGFSVGYFQQPWGLAVGYAASFGTQAAIVAIALVPFTILYKYGKFLRNKGKKIV